MKKPIIIYFLEDGIPSAAERAEADSFGVKVMFRNVRFIEPDDHAEECDAVAGSIIPEQYKDLPGPEEALAEYAEGVKAQRELVGDVPAPSREEIEQAVTVAPADVAAKNPAIRSPKGGWSKGK